MNRKKEIQKELESISPFLAKLDRPEQAETPYLYFDKLADRVLNQVKEEKKTTWWESILNQFSPKKAVGFASIAILIAAAILLLPPNTETPSDSFANLDAAEINDYIAMNIEDFEETTLYEYSDLSSLDVDFWGDDMDESDMDDLIDEWVDEVDIETIEEFL